MRDDKYIVFKRSDWDDWRERVGTDSAAAFRTPPSLDDAVVIRKQDIFAGSALHAYASSITTALEIIDYHNVVLGGRHRQRLDEIRDYFFEQALEADDVRTKKVPD